METRDFRKKRVKHKKKRKAVSEPAMSVRSQMHETPRTLVGDSLEKERQTQVG